MGRFTSNQKWSSAHSAHIIFIYYENLIVGYVVSAETRSFCDICLPVWDGRLLQRPSGRASGRLLYNDDPVLCFYVIVRTILHYVRIAIFIIIIVTLVPETHNIKTKREPWLHALRLNAADIVLCV